MAEDRKISLFDIKTDIGILITLATVLGLAVYSTFFMGRIPYSSGVIHSFQPKFVVLVITSILYLVVGGGFGLLFILSFCQVQKAKLFWAIISCYIFVTAWFGAVPLHGRYLDPVFILLLILSFFSVKTIIQHKDGKGRLNNKLLVIAFTISILTVVFALALQEDLVNAATIGFSYLSQISLFGAVFSVFIMILFFTRGRQEPTKKVVYTITILFFIILGCNFVYNDVKGLQHIYTHTTINYGESEIGRWASENKINSLYFDEDDYRKLWVSFCLSQFWYHRRYVQVLNLTEDTKKINSPFYLITTKEFDDLHSCRVELVKIEEVHIPFTNNSMYLFLYRIL